MRAALGTFWKQPRKTWLRAALFHMHLWSGLAVGIATAIAGASGSALVLQNEIESRTTAALHQVDAHIPPPTIDEVLRQLHLDRPDIRIEDLTLAPAPEAWQAYAEVGGSGGPVKKVYIDPVRGRYIPTPSVAALMDWLVDLHVSLMLGDHGEQINGWGAVLLFSLCVTGIVIWWPGRGRVRRATRVHWKARWPRLNWDLHSAGGFWIALPLAVEALTSIYMVFPAPFLLLAVTIFGGSYATANQFRDVPSIKPLSTGASRPSIDSMQQIALRRHPELMLSRMAFPQRDTEPFTFRLAARPGAPDRDVRVSLGPDGVVVQEHDSVAIASRGQQVADYLGLIHTGEFGGLSTKILWVPLGLTPGLLFMTGFVIWWRRLVRPRLRRTKWRGARLQK